MTFDLISSFGGLLLPPIFDFLKKKFIPSDKDTPEATLSNLATTKPEVITSYTEAQAKLLQSQKDYFNRDVIGTPSTWIIDLRAVIRPLFVVVSLATILVDIFYDVKLDSGLKYFMESCICSWFGSRLTNDK